MAIDLNRVITDANSFDELTSKTHKRLRYSVINAGAGFPANVVHRAMKYKSWAGASSYTLAALEEFYAGCKPDRYKVTCVSQVGGVVNKFVRETSS
jgi:diacylglycerol kinase family enzyme